MRILSVHSKLSVLEKYRRMERFIFICVGVISACSM